MKKIFFAVCTIFFLSACTLISNKQEGLVSSTKNQQSDIVQSNFMSLGSGFILEQDQENTYLKYNTNVLKTFSNSGVVMQLLEAENVCPKVFEKNNKQESIINSIDCKKEYLLYKKLRIENTNNPQFFILVEGSYEGWSTYLIDIEKKKTYQDMGSIRTDNISFQKGKNGTYFMVDNVYGDCHGQIYLLTDDDRLIAQEDVCKKEAMNTMVSVKSFELKDNEHLFVKYRVGEPPEYKQFTEKEVRILIKK